MFRTDMLLGQSAACRGSLTVCSAEPAPARKDLGAVDDTSTWTAAALEPHDSVFVQFSADKAVAAAEEQVLVEQA